MLQQRQAMLMGLGIGAGLMYLLDPVGGGRRRALARDRVVHATHAANDAAGATARDMANRAAGVVARVRSAKIDEPVDDRVLEERVRAQLGRAVSHPRAVEVHAANGVITLRGPILAAEVAPLCRAAGRVKGVREVVDELDAHDEPGNIPPLQGGVTPGTMWRGAWSPTARVLTTLAATAGAGLVARAVTRG